MTQKTLAQPEDQLDPQDIREYLISHPRFFEENPDLLATLSLPHESGSAVSLIERQVTVLRERNIEMRNRLGNMLETARENDKLFDRSKRLILSLLDAQSIDDVTESLYDSLGDDFNIQYYSLTLFDLVGTGHRANVVSRKEAEKAMGTLLQSGRPVCGILRESELEFLFGEDAGEVGSVAAMPLHRGSKIIGILALGNNDPQFYRSSMGTLFLSHVAEILARILPRLM
ncbi:MAG: DUF484 family protein [bacterium]